MRHLLPARSTPPRPLVDAAAAQRHRQHECGAGTAGSQPDARWHQGRGRPDVRRACAGDEWRQPRRCCPTCGSPSRWCESQLEKSPSSNAMLRTTTALTIVRAGNKDNVLPGRAEAAVNFRILPGDTHRQRRGPLAQDAWPTTTSRSSGTPATPSRRPCRRPTAPATARSSRPCARTFPDAVVAPGPR